ncbi:MAG: hypothetical protein M8843_00130 [marine benthic group bacterium]|nr:hypothetical protein [Gemmatimonadota bacterium]
MHQPAMARIATVAACLGALAAAAGCQDILRDMVGVVPDEGVYRGEWELTDPDGKVTDHEGYVSIDISATHPDVHGGLGVDGGHRFEGRMNFWGDLYVTATTGVFAPHTDLSGSIDCSETDYSKSCRMDLEGTNSESGIEFSFRGWRTS